MTRTNRLPGGDDKHDYRTRQPHHRASPTPRASANFNRKCPSMDTTDDIRQPPPVPKPRPPLRCSKVVSSRRKTTPERRHHPIRRFGAFTRDEEGRARGGLRSRLQEGEQRRSAAGIVAAANSQGVSPIHPPERKHHRQICSKGKRGSPRSRPRSPPIRRPRGQKRRSRHLHQPPAEGGPTRSTSCHRHHARRNRAEPSTTEPNALPPGTGPATAARRSAVTPSASATPPPADPDPRRP
nr:serine/arginine-rich splicing factor SR45-like [Aegilops tauschii subsp. strangulata]